jgi:hypothetical protein
VIIPGDYVSDVLLRRRRQERFAAVRSKLRDHVPGIFTRTSEYNDALVVSVSGTTRTVYHLEAVAPQPRGQFIHTLIRANSHGKMRRSCLRNRVHLEIRREGMRKRSNQ